MSFSKGNVRACFLLPMDQLRAWKEGGHCLVDLRKPGDFATVHLINSTNIPGDEFYDRVQELPERVR
jgi:rhodanese-related sulfurtransferase